MKKIDFHIHTVPSIKDSHFTFSLTKLKTYVETTGLDAISITNHDLFDVNQFLEISRTLDIPVFPGIEISLAETHVLLICDPSDLGDFNARCNLVSQKIANPEDSINIDEFFEIFEAPQDYIVIPHYSKKPAIGPDTLARIVDFISAAEVNSAKKFIRLSKSDEKLTPVLFSDVRIQETMASFPTRHTYVDCGEVTFASIKGSLRDKRKVALSKADGNRLFAVFDDGQTLSTGLNVLLGERSSGKTHTLDRIAGALEETKYIRQFSLLQSEDHLRDREFNDDVQRKRSVSVERYLSGFKSIVEDVADIDLAANERDVSEFISTLLRSAEEADRKDEYSRAKLFNEDEYPIQQARTLRELIASIRQVIENIEFRDVIERHVSRSALQRLAIELIELFREKTLESAKKEWVNSAVRDIKVNLKMRSSDTQISNVDLYQAALDIKKVERFKSIVNSLRRDAVVSEEQIQGFRVVVRKGPYTGAGELKAVSRSQSAFKEAFNVYDDPYRFLHAIQEVKTLHRTEIYKYFSKITYTILNGDGYEVSGGERSEFRLLQEIADAQNYDILLIDEPESSFDNLFLESSVNEMIREISECMPVVVVTHNSTVGASISADYVIVAQKEKSEGGIEYRLYSGHPSNSILSSRDGREIANYDAMMNSLEAGHEVYTERKKVYEAIRS
ncbi:phosphotransferase [Calycomorphotria hydatis]|uniref:Phosphate transporter ATP-binding protein n=1 Tax=Calycomorphotria hydatis TaxID=2528027 RepID=A0A517TET8_9PLAN|nr:phosphotransferase [Calycomorphotria hydatis]QDT66900.1 phosphate transporter ATP-binding protein [Calycomorphotria hydatis]